MRRKCSRIDNALDLRHMLATKEGMVNFLQSL